VTTPLYLEPQINSTPFEFYHQTYSAKACDIWRLFSEKSVILASAVIEKFSSNFVVKRIGKSRGIVLLFSENRVILASAVLSRYTRVTDDKQ